MGKLQYWKAYVASVEAKQTLIKVDSNIKVAFEDVVVGW